MYIVYTTYFFIAFLGDFKQNLSLNFSIHGENLQLPMKCSSYIYILASKGKAIRL